ncbi:hypothetical protein X943_002657 [Babesia divergens]|uniref:Uncharacterized protein n=1 Tax=Babesia divergens TaxID=32595 RepID=A0AAD9GFN4_BABDI|nr:hypothetical protein X943_002657 [Babesia divergens]
MDLFEDFKGVDTCRYLGIAVSVLFTSGETLKGELYYVDFHRTQTIILKVQGRQGGDRFCLIRPSAVKSITALGCPNESVDEIPRVTQEALLECMNNISLSEDEYSQKQSQNEGPMRVSHQKPWSVRAPVTATLMCGNTEALPQDNKQWAMA